MRNRKPHSKETKEKISLANTGILSSQWKGNKAKYQALHGWIRRHHGPANHCSKCKKTDKEYQWALKPGRKYSRNINDYDQLCRSCHQKQDMTDSRREKARIASTGRFSSNKKNSVFMWLKAKFGSANHCEFKNCLGTSRNYCWILKKNKSHQHKRSNYKMACISCKNLNK
jgi:hypothetical protein